ncbi:MAG: phosphoheptose isomerase [Elusimicrobia bacterium RIFOXYB2_FULL_48_7]|nr:MAG: phosphoheptose isomerase [Elusimicrobia bacterium RIFOXYB2_FULL_48_7]
MKQQIARIIKESIEIKEKILKKNAVEIEEIARQIIDAYKKKNKVVVFGNGGSAADAIHLAAELVARFQKERQGLEAVALPSNISLITAIANDYGFEKVFSRQVESLVKKGDVVIGISTSGNSKNVNLAIKQAKKQGAVTVGWTGENGGELKHITDYCIRIPSNSTPRIQEGHVMVLHILCSLVENELFPENK